jgi:hypothetical protein
MPCLPSAIYEAERHVAALSGTFFFTLRYRRHLFYFSALLVYLVRSVLAFFHQLFYPESLSNFSVFIYFILYYFISSSFPISSYLILSSLVWPPSVLKNLISTDCILLRYPVLIFQNSHTSLLHIITLLEHLQ